MDYGKAFSYVFEDKDWIKKIAIGAVVSLVPIVNFALFGYVAEILRRVAQGEAQVLPEWDKFGDLFMKGLQIVVINFVYFLPVIVVNICSAIANAGLGAAAVGLANGDNSSTVGILSTVSTVVQVCLSCLVFLAAIGASFLLPAAWGTFVETGQLGAALRIGDIVKLFRGSPGPFIISNLILTAAYFVLAPVGFLVCVVGVFVALAYLGVVAGHLYGQAYREAKSKSGGMMTPAMPQM